MSYIEKLNQRSVVPMEKSCRPKRQRRHIRRTWPSEDDEHQVRPTKRLFTLDIKRMLKDWLIRRRENPYPTRDEKKRLAVDTGLTYTQICNWFANWRRKLKNSERQREGQQSWGHLIKNYNSNARGNVEQFSISSEDSIWGEQHNRYMEFNSNDYDEDSRETLTHSMDAYYATTAYNQVHYNSTQANQTYDTYKDGSVNSTDTISTLDYNNNSSNTKYKQKIMEKYMREEQAGTQQMMETTNTKELSKWLESAANFTPNKNNYYIEWNNKRDKFENEKSAMQLSVSDAASVSNQTDTNSSNMDSDIIHHKDELDAAEALANMAFNCRQRMAFTNQITENSFQNTVQASRF